MKILLIILGWLAYMLVIAIVYAICAVLTARFGLWFFVPAMTVVCVIGYFDWVFNASIVIYDNDLAPVWYEFITDFPDKQNNDFSFDKLKEFYKR